MFIIDDIINAIASANAAAQQEKAAKEAMGLQREMWETQRADQAPWLEAGRNSLAQLLRLNADPSSIASSPAFQFRLAEGQKALERSAAARGGLNSGGFMKDLTRYSQGLASDEYGNQWNRLAGLAGVGQNSAQSLGGLGSNYANMMSQLYGAQGNANAAGQIAIGHGFSDSIRSLGNLALMGMGGGFAGLGGAGAGAGAMMPGAGASFASGYIPTQGFNLPQLRMGG